MERITLNNRYEIVDKVGGGGMLMFMVVIVMPAAISILTTNITT